MPELRALARWRVPLGFVAAFAVLWLARPTRASIALGAAVAVMGEGLRIWAAGHLHKSREVTASGPYRLFAHPLYVGSSIMGLGLAAASNSVLAAALIGLYLLVTISIAVRTEEAFLREKFGDRYDQYRRAGAGKESRAGGVDESRRFSLRQAMVNREYRAVLGLVAVLLFLIWRMGR
jgi:protein-S-isoprenylcysteine O-methyltransferase Ste14